MTKPQPSTPHHQLGGPLRRTTALAAIALLPTLAACTDDDTDSAGPRSGTDQLDPTDTIPAETIPSHTGTIDLTIGDVTYRASIPNCIIDPDTDTVDFIATGNHDDQPIRIEHGQSTSGRLGLFINPTSPLHPGDTTWTGQPTFTINGQTAHAELELTDLATSQTAPATVEVACDE